MARKKEIKRMICTVSHEKPIPGGGFAQFEAGREYPINQVPGGSPYFRPVVEEDESTGEEED